MFYSESSKLYIVYRFAERVNKGIVLSVMNPKLTVVNASAI
jgi:hypothetical protein